MNEVLGKQPNWGWGKILTVFLAFPLLLCGAFLCIFPPYGGNTRKSAKNTACISNMKQLGTATLIYCSDFDDAPPVCHMVGEPYYAGGLGWGGRIFPYAGGKRFEQTFRCPFEFTEHQEEKLEDGLFRVDYAMNSNLAVLGTKMDSENAKTVLFFEVDGSKARLSQPDEGRQDATEYLQMSPVGSGVVGDLYGHIGSGTDPGLRYATGVFDNSAFSQLDNTDDLRRPWHEGKTHILAMDSHAKTVMPNAVSAGRTAHSAKDAQTPTTCGESAQWPCAAGTGDTTHTFTFSVK